MSANLHPTADSYPQARAQSVVEWWMSVWWGWSFYDWIERFYPQRYVLGVAGFDEMHFWQQPPSEDHQ